LKISNLCDHNTSTLRTDRQTDGQTTCDRNTALCTKVHRAVIKFYFRCQIVQHASYDTLSDLSFVCLICFWISSQ